MASRPDQISRELLAWVLVAQAVIIVPQIDRLPIWVVGAWLLIAWWHYKIYRGDWRYPNWIVKVLLVIASFVGIFTEFPDPRALEPQVALLVSALILKLLELRGRRDVWVILGLGYFTVACQFLFEQELRAMPVALLQMTSLLMVQTVLHSHNTPLFSMFGSTLKQLAQAIPVLVVIFVLFPRIGPLWSIPLPGESAVTGLSDSMSPGDIARLSRSTELAFRVRFDGDIPASSELYWRGLVLEDFDGRTWHRNAVLRREALPMPAGGRELRYDVTLQSGVHRWLMSIPYSRISRNDVTANTRFEWVPDKPLTGRLHYSVRSFPDHPVDVELDEQIRSRNLYLPRRSNPDTEALGERWSEEYARPAERVQAALNYLSEQPFTYTLEPPLLGQRSVDEFLFDTRAGFCEHFAGSFVYLMRSADVPARVVLGYQGGERNNFGGYLLVHQSDAHAWAEVWLRGRGWVRVDPTSVIAPSRIELGANEALSGESAFLADGGLSLRRFGSWANQFRFWMDNIDYVWAKWVLNFDQDSQWSLLGLLPERNLRYLLLVIGIGIGVPLAIAAWITLRPLRKRHSDPLVEQYLRCCRRLLKQGVVLRNGETPSAFARRAAAEYPECKPWIEEVTREFQRGYYQPEQRGVAAEALQRLRQLSRQSRWSSAASG